MKNHKRFEYFNYAPAPNIVVGLNHSEVAAEGRDFEIVIHEALAPLLLPIAKKYPQYEFISSHRWLRNKVVVVEHVTVMHNGDEIGEVKWESRYTRNGLISCVAIGNSRIADTKERGGMFRKTTDIPKAIKLFTKMFQPVSHVERMKKAKSDAGGALSIHAYNKSAEFDTEYNTVFNGLKDFVMANLGELRPILDRAGVPPRIIERMQDTYVEYTTVGTIRDAYNEGKAKVVHTFGETYIVCSGLNPITTEAYSTHTLPASLKRGLGMLKLVENGQYLSNIGFRSDASTYIVIPVEGEENHE